MSIKRLSLAVVVLLVAIAKANACSRIYTSIESTITIADTIFVGTVKSVTKDGLLQVDVQETLKGRVNEKVKLKGFPYKSSAVTSMCEIQVASVGAKYYFFAFDKRYGQNYHIASNLSDAVYPANQRRRKTIKELLAKEAPSSDWRFSASTGLYARLVTGKRSYKGKEELNLSIIFLNHTNRNLTLNYRTWPKSEHSYCNLLISSKKGKVAAVPVPIDRSKIENYFSKHGHRYDHVLTKDSSFEFGISSISTAQKGYGYKEKLNFQYYPLSPGSYNIAASCKNFFGATINTNSIKVKIV